MAIVGQNLHERKTNSKGAFESAPEDVRFSGAGCSPVTILILNYGGSASICLRAQLPLPLTRVSQGLRHSIQRSGSVASRWHCLQQLLSGLRQAHPSR